MSVTGSRYVAKALEELHLYSILGYEGSVFSLELLLKLRIDVSTLVSVAEFIVVGEEVYILIGSLGEPGKVIYRYGVDLYLISLWLNTKVLEYHIRKEFLCTEYLVAAAEGLDLWEDSIECLYTQSHRVGIVDYPRVGAKFLYVAGNLLVHRDSAHRSDYTTGAAGISNGLIDAVLLGSVHVALHLIKRAGQDRDDDKISTGKRLGGSLGCKIIPLCQSTLNTVELIADYLIVLRRRVIYIIKMHGS